MLEPVALLLSFGVTLLALRLYFMGCSPPLFSPADNPAADSDSLVTRTLTFLYLPVFNFLLLVFPVTLSFDWSMGAIPLVESLADCRVMLILIFYASLIWLIKYSLSYFCDSARAEELSERPSSPRHYKNGTSEVNGHFSKLSNGAGYPAKNGGSHYAVTETVAHRRCRKDSSSSAESTR